MAQVTTTGSVLKQLFSCYPNTQVTDETSAMYLRLLKDIPPAELQTVVDQAIAESEFLPTIAKLRDMYLRLGNVGKLTYVEAWAIVQKEIRRIGSYRKPEFSDPIVAKVVESMGWRNLCMSEEPDIMRSQFEKAYKALAERQDGLDKLLPQSRQLAAQRSGLLPVGRMLEDYTRR